MSEWTNSMRLATHGINFFSLAFPPTWSKVKREVPQWSPHSTHQQSLFIGSKEGRGARIKKTALGNTQRGREERASFLCIPSPYSLALPLKMLRPKGTPTPHSLPVPLLGNKFPLYLPVKTRAARRDRGPGLPVGNGMDCLGAWGRGRYIPEVKGKQSKSGDAQCPGLGLARTSSRHRFLNEGSASLKVSTSAKQKQIRRQNWT